MHPSRPTPLAAALLLALLLAPARADVTATDTLAAQLDTPAHRAVLEPITWQPTTFTVHVTEPPADLTPADRLVSFPSPLPQAGESPAVNTVDLEWFVVRDEAGEVAAAPAVVIVPETSRRKDAAVAVARGLRHAGVHALVMNPPGYGRRTGSVRGDDPAKLVSFVRQAAADARRSLDAVRALPGLANQPVHLSGVSLGGFIAALGAQLDGGQDGLFILLAGGDLHAVVSEGKRDAAKFRQRLAAAGYEGQRLEDLLWQIEPMRGADRLDPARTWLYSGIYDTVVPLASAERFAEAVGLAAGHHVKYPADHYTAILMLPAVVQHIAERVRGGEE